jgi:hypothetical protein
MGSIVAEIADKIASAGGGERSELEVRGGTGADGGGILTLSTSELTVVDGDKLGRIDFQAPLETGTDAIVVSASIWAEADDTFAADNNSTELVFATGASEAAAEKMRITSDGKVGIGTSSPGALLEIQGPVGTGATGAGTLRLSTAELTVVDNDQVGRIEFIAPLESSGTDAILVGASIYGEAEATFAADDNSTAIVFATGTSAAASEKMRINRHGNVGIGTAAPLDLFHVKAGASGQGTPHSYTQFLLESDDHVGINILTPNNKKQQIMFGDSDNVEAGAIVYNHSTNQMGLTVNAAEKMTIAPSGRTGINYTTPDTAITSGVGGARTFMQYIINPPAAADGLLYLQHHYAAQAGAALFINANGRSSNSGFEFIRCITDADDDLQFYVRGDGYVASDGGVDHSSADYAEFFEWADGNLSSEDRTGFSVVFDDTTSNQIRKATSDDAASALIGVVSAVPAVTGDSDMDVKYVHRFQKDDYNRWITEEHTLTQWTDSDGEHVDYHTDRIPDDVTVPDDAVVITDEADGSKFTRKIENDDYDASNTYTPRRKRKEWDTIGLMGKLRMKKGQPTGDRWIKMRVISSSVEEWLVR